MKELLFTCPKCGVSGRWVDLCFRSDIVEESWCGARPGLVMFHVCARILRPSLWQRLRRWAFGSLSSVTPVTEEFAYLNSGKIHTEAVEMTKMTESTVER